MKAAPPFEAVWKGNDQMFPSPTALPTAAKIKPILLVQDSCSAIYGTRLQGPAL